MGYIYIYRINTPVGTVIKVGHGSTKPQVRLKDYCDIYGLDVDVSSLKYVRVPDSQAGERSVHNELINKGYRNIRDGRYGPQEMFQAPKGASYNDASKLVIKLARDWKRGYIHIDYSASDLIDKQYSDNFNIENYKVLNQLPITVKWMIIWLINILHSLLKTSYGVFKYLLRWILKSSHLLAVIALSVFLFYLTIYLAQTYGFIGILFAIFIIIYLSKKIGYIGK